MKSPVSCAILCCALCYLMALPTILFALSGLLIFSAAAELLNKAIITPADQVFTILLGPDVP